LLGAAAVGVAGKVRLQLSQEVFWKGEGWVCGLGSRCGRGSDVPDPRDVLDLREAESLRDRSSCLNSTGLDRCGFGALNPKLKLNAGCAAIGSNGAGTTFLGSFCPLALKRNGLPSSECIEGGISECPFTLEMCVPITALGPPSAGVRSPLDDVASGMTPPDERHCIGECGVRTALNLNATSIAATSNVLPPVGCFVVYVLPAALLFGYLAAALSAVGLVLERVYPTSEGSRRRVVDGLLYLKGLGAGAMGSLLSTLSGKTICGLSENDANGRGNLRGEAVNGCRECFRVGDSKKWVIWS